MPCPELRTCRMEVREQWYNKYCISRKLYENCYTWKEKHLSQALPDQWLRHMTPEQIDKIYSEKEDE